MPTCRCGSGRRRCGGGGRRSPRVVRTVEQGRRVSLDVQSEIDARTSGCSMLPRSGNPSAIHGFCVSDKYGGRQRLEAVTSSWRRCAMRSSSAPASLLVMKRISHEVASSFSQCGDCGDTNARVSLVSGTVPSVTYTGMPSGSPKRLSSKPSRCRRSSGSPGYRPGPRSCRYRRSCTCIARTDTRRERPLPPAGTAGAAAPSAVSAWATVPGSMVTGAAPVDAMRSPPRCAARATAPLRGT